MKIPHPRNHKTLSIIVAAVAIVVLGLWINQLITLRKAHSTFANYYAFRGCVQLVQRQPDYGVCKTKSGATIKIVQYRGRWYLDHDLPMCLRNLCF